MLAKSALSSENVEIKKGKAMRLHEELIKQAILHPQQDVRTEAVLYFSRSHSSDGSILPSAIQAIEQYGWDEAFDVASCMTSLPLNDATLPWVLTQLQHQDAKKLDRYDWPVRWYTLNSLLSGCDAELLARHKQAILALDCLDDDAMATVIERIDLVTASGDFCWQELEKFCVESKDIDNLDDVDLDHAYALCEAIGRDKDKYAEKVLSVLHEKIDDFKSNPKVWMETFAVRMAGEMRLEAAIPLIIAKLKEAGEEADWHSEECETALAKIGGDVTVSAVAEMFRSGDWHLRQAACNILEHIHTDLAVSMTLELLPSEEDGTIRAALAVGLASHLAFEAIEPLRQLVIDGTYDDSYADLKRDVVLAATLMNVELPEREQWKIELERGRREREGRAAEAQRPILEDPDEYEDEEPPRTKTGRNDPCPCGSGRKFKKCCLSKRRTDLLT